MKTIMAARCSQLPFLFPVISLILLGPLVGKAQNRSSLINLEGTQWVAKPFSMVNVDASTTVITFTYFFGRDRKVKLVAFSTKDAGVIPLTNQPGTIVTSHWESWGTYKVSGGTVHIDFPKEIIRATINGSLMKGVVTLKGTNEKEEWMVERESTQPNRSTETSPYPNVIRITEGKLSPAKGYRWVNPNDPNDFRVELIPGNRSENRSSDLTGNWEGTYICGQGLTNLNLAISQNSSSEISAIFKFSASKSNPAVPSGSFRMTGTYDSRTNKIVLNATQWVNRPAGYITVDLVGKVSQGNTTISGEVVSSNCSTFTVEKK
jgi:hypothetical protein